jgi:hypothetical protein
LIIEGLLAVDMRLEWCRMNSTLRNLRKGSSGRVLRRIRWLPRVPLWVTAVRDLNGDLLMEGLLESLLRALGKAGGFDVCHGDVLLGTRLMHWYGHRPVFLGHWLLRQWEYLWLRKVVEGRFPERKSGLELAGGVYQRHVGASGRR